MRFLILLFLSFNCFAIEHYVQRTSVGNCANSQIVYSGPMALSECSKLGECLEIKENPYYCGYSKIEKELVDDLSRPQYSKRVTYDCGEYCQSLWNEGGTYTQCNPDEQEAILNLELEQIYCIKLTGYEKKESGRDIVVIDQALKDAHDQYEIDKKQKEEQILIGKINREKCERALDFIGGQNSDLTIEQVDQMMIAFGDIYTALSSARIDKAKLLLNAVTDPAYQDLKNSLLGILE